MKQTCLFILIVILGCKRQAVQEDKGLKFPIDEYEAGDSARNEKYAAFHPESWEQWGDQPYLLKFTGIIGKDHVVCFSQARGCTDILCQEMLKLFLIREDSIIFRLSTPFNRELDPPFEVLHDAFLQCVEVRHQWYESDEFEAMDYDAADDYVGGLRLVLKGDSLVRLEDLSRADLRLYRNLVFAGYGYVFQSKDLQEYFGSTDWYRPDPEVNGRIDELLTGKDSVLIKSITELEERME